MLQSVGLRIISHCLRRHFQDVGRVISTWRLKQRSLSAATQRAAWYSLVGCHLVNIKQSHTRDFVSSVVKQWFSHMKSKMAAAINLSLAGMRLIRRSIEDVCCSAVVCWRCSAVYATSTRFRKRIADLEAAGRTKQLQVSSQLGRTQQICRMNSQKSAIHTIRAWSAQRQNRRFTSLLCNWLLQAARAKGTAAIQHLDISVGNNMEQHAHEISSVAIGAMQSRGLQVVSKLAVLNTYGSIMKIELQCLCLCVRSLEASSKGISICQRAKFSMQYVPAGSMHP